MAVPAPDLCFWPPAWLPVQAPTKASVRLRLRMQDAFVEMTPFKPNNEETWNQSASLQLETDEAGRVRSHLPQALVGAACANLRP